MKNYFATAIAEAARKRPELVVLACDYGFDTWTQFERDNPGRFRNCGIAEQSTIGLAAGLALDGMLPVVYGITPFVIERGFEQLKLDIVQQNLKVIFGLYSDYKHDGPTHMELGFFRLLNMLRGLGP